LDAGDRIYDSDRRFLSSRTRRDRNHITIISDFVHRRRYSTLVSVKSCRLRHSLSQKLASKS
jgi:hypothetical protein